MEEEYISVLEGVLQYEKKESIIVFACFILGLLVLSFVVIRQYKKISKVNKGIIVLIFIALIIAFILGAIQSRKKQSNILADLNNKDFVQYQGEYFHDDYLLTAFYHNVYISEEELLQLPDYGNDHQIHANFEEMPLGSVNGTVVYGKKSKIIVDWQ